MSGAAGTNLPWMARESSAHRQEFVALKNFVQDIDFIDYKFEPQSNSGLQGDDKDPNIEAYTLVSDDKKFAMGWVHNRSNYWRRIANSNTCLQEVIEESDNDLFDLPDESDDTEIPKSVLNPFERRFVINELKPLAPYLVHFYNTTDGSDITNSPNFGLPIHTDLNGRLVVDIPELDQNRPDIAFKVIHDPIFQRSAQHAQNTNPVNDYIKVKISPNPVSSFLKIEGIVGIASVTIFDNLGKTAYKWSMTENEPINISHLATGHYIIEISNGNRTERQKLHVAR